MWFIWELSSGFPKSTKSKNNNTHGVTFTDYDLSRSILTWCTFYIPLKIWIWSDYPLKAMLHKWALHTGTYTHESPPLQCRSRTSLILFYFLLVEFIISRLKPSVWWYLLYRIVGNPANDVKIALGFNMIMTIS